MAKIGHLEAPTQPRHKGLENVAALVKERTKGAVEFQLYPSSQLGNARQMMESTEFGGSEGTVMPAAFLAAGFQSADFRPRHSVHLPNRPGHVREASRWRIRKALLQSFSTRGVHALTIRPNGRKSLTSNKPLKGCSIEGQKFA